MAGLFALTKGKVDFGPRADYFRHEFALEKRFPLHRKIHFGDHDKGLLDFAIHLADVNAVDLVGTAVQGDVHIADVARVAIEVSQRFIHIL